MRDEIITDLAKSLSIFAINFCKGKKELCDKYSMEWAEFIWDTISEDIKYELVKKLEARIDKTLEEVLK